MTRIYTPTPVLKAEPIYPGMDPGRDVARYFLSGRYWHAAAVGSDAGPCGAPVQGYITQAVLPIALIGDLCPVCFEQLRDQRQPELPVRTVPGE
jgi:hypothetical protein